MTIDRQQILNIKTAEFSGNQSQEDIRHAENAMPTQSTNQTQWWKQKQEKDRQETF